MKNIFTFNLLLLRYWE